MNDPPLTVTALPPKPFGYWVECGALPGESVLAAAERQLVSEFLYHAGGRQDLAARKLRISPRRMNYICQRYGMRPKDHSAT